MTDKFRPIFNILLFCATVVAMFAFIMFVANEVKSPAEGGDAYSARSQENGHGVVCRDKPVFYCEASGEVLESWMQLAEKSAQLNTPARSWMPEYADILAINRTDAEFLALFNVAEGEFRLITTDTNTPDLGVRCRGAVPSFTLYYDPNLPDPWGVRLQALTALEHFAARYNRVVTLQPEYPYPHICTPVLDIGSTDTFFVVPDGYAAAVWQGREKQCQENSSCRLEKTDNKKQPE